MRKSIYTTFIAERTRKPVLPARKQLQLLTDQVVSIPGNRMIFESPVAVKKENNEHLFTCFGVWADRSQGLWVLDGCGDWHQLTHDQANAGLMITALHEKIKSFSNERSKILFEC